MKGRAASPEDFWKQWLRWGSISNQHFFAYWSHKIRGCIPWKRKQVFLNAAAAHNGSPAFCESLLSWLGFLLALSQNPLLSASLLSAGSFSPTAWFDAFSDKKGKEGLCKGQRECSLCVAVAARCWGWFWTQSNLKVCTQDMWSGSNSTAWSQTGSSTIYKLSWWLKTSKPRLTGLMEHN